jgi:hypothetical protein
MMKFPIYGKIKMVQTTNQKTYIVVNPVINLDWETAWGWFLSGFATSKITMKQHQ